jgi:hypothetical protein
LSLFFLIPIVYQVETINNKVLGLFGIIPSKEIEHFSEKANIYIKNFIEDKYKAKDLAEDEAE